MENKTINIENQFVERRNKIYPPESMKIERYWSEISVHRYISWLLEQVLIPLTTQKIIFEELSNYNDLITDESKKAVLNVLQEVIIYPKDLHDLVLLARSQTLSIYGKLISYFQAFKQLDVAPIFSEKHHTSVFNSLTKEEQLTLVNNLKRYLKSEWYEKIRLHRDMYNYNNGKSFKYNPNDIDKENYRQAVQKNINNIPQYHNDILASIINHPQYQNIWKPLIIELHELAEQSKITEMYIKVTEFIQEHDHTLFSDDISHFIVICLHCHNHVRPILRSLLYYFDILNQTHKLQNITWYQNRRDYILENKKKRIINWIKRQIKNTNYDNISILEKKKTSQNAISWLDEQGIEKLSEHYISYWYDINIRSIPSYEYKWNTFHFRKTIKDYQLDKKEDEKINFFCNTNFREIYELLRQEYIQHIFLYEYIHNDLENYSLKENDDSNSLRTIDKNNLYNYLRKIEKTYIQKFQPNDLWYFEIIVSIPGSIKDFYDKYDFDNSYPEFLMTSDPGHGISKLPWIDYRPKAHILRWNNMMDYLSNNWSSDQIIILEDDLAEANQYKIILSQHQKSITHLTKQNDIKNHIKDNQNQIFILDLQQPDNKLWWIHAIETIVSHRESIGKDNYNNLIRILLRSTSDEIYNIESHYRNLMTRWEQANVFIDFKKKWVWIIDKLV